MNKYTEYILSVGDKLNQEIKDNIYMKNGDLLKLLLIDYVNDTLNNYDVRNCPDFCPDDDVISPEELNITTYTTEDGLFTFIMELGNIEFITEDSLYEEPTYDHDVFTSESGEWILTEGDFERYMFDKKIIETFLTQLTRDLRCKI